MTTIRRKKDPLIPAGTHQKVEMTSCVAVSVNDYDRSVTE